MITLSSEYSCTQPKQQSVNKEQRFAQCLDEDGQLWWARLDVVYTYEGEIAECPSLQPLLGSWREGIAAIVDRAFAFALMPESRVLGAGEYRLARDIKCPLINFEPRSRQSLLSQEVWGSWVLFQVLTQNVDAFDPKNALYCPRSDTTVSIDVLLASVWSNLTTFNTSAACFGR